jgi:hypothetical protein
MNCNDSIDILKTYDSTDEWPALLPSRLRDHLDSCRKCAGFYALLGRERNAYDSYNAALMPSGDVWKAIETRLQSAAVPYTAASGRWWQLDRRIFTPAFAAACLFVTFAAVCVWWYLSTRPPATEVGTNVTTPNIAVPQVSVPSPQPIVKTNDGERLPLSLPRRRFVHPAVRSRVHSSLRPGGTEVRLSTDPNEVAVREVELRYNAAIASLTRDIARQRPALSPDLMAQFRASLPELDSRISSSRQAVREQAFDPLAVQSLNDAYGRKIDFLRQIVEK